MRGADIDHELPWGYWLRAEPNSPSGSVVICEATGKEWSSIRYAMWTDRLRQSGDAYSSDKIEFLHRVLNCFARGTMNSREVGLDLFGGSSDFQTWYYGWLAGAGFIKKPSQASELTSEGHSVLLMLTATRPSEVRKERPSAVTVNQLRTLGLGPISREERLQEVESVAIKWDVAFVRKQIGARPTVTLFTRGNGAMPIQTPKWTLHFDSSDARDVFYEWLCARFDRWVDWAETMRSGNNDRMTQRLMSVMAASLEPAPIPLVA